MATILVVDDSPINRDLVVSLLRYAGHEPHEACDGREALDFARSIEPDLVVSDILMPSMDGIELAEHLRNDEALAHVPVIFHTATYRVSEARTLAERCGVSTVVSKPCEPQHLLDAVHEALGTSAKVVAEEHIATFMRRSTQPAFERTLASCTDELLDLQWAIRAEIEHVDVPAVRARRLHELSTRLDASVNHSQALSLRLAALSELGPTLASYKDAAQLLDAFCHAGRDIMNARLASACTLDEHGRVLDFACYGVPSGQLRELRDTLQPMAGVLGKAMQSGTTQTWNGIDGRDASSGLPAAHPAVENLLVVPLKSPTRTYGWFYTADRLAGSSFTEEDEQLAEALVAQLAPEYENLLLLDRVNRHAGLLEIEADERKRVLAKLEESNARFRQLAASVHEVFFLLDGSTGHVLYVSPAYARVWGRSTESLYEQPGSWLDAVHGDDYRRVLEGLARAARTSEAELTFRILRSDGTRWIRARAFPVLDQGRRLKRIAGTAEDVTESRLAERRIARLSRIRAVLSGINSAIVRMRERGPLLDEVCRVAVVHGGFRCAWVGLKPAAARELELVSYRGARTAEAEAIASALAEEHLEADDSLLTRTMHSDGHVVFNELNGEASAHRALELAREFGCGAVLALRLAPDAQAAGAIVLFSEEAGVFDEDELRLLDELAGDVSFALEFISRGEQLEHLAHYDALTDLPNTALLHDHLDRLIEQQPDDNAALFLVDLDNFTHLNDTLGRHVGDQLLIGFAQRLQTMLGAHCEVARIGSDTFAVAVPELNDESEVSAVLQERIAAALNKPFELEGDDLRVSARIGVAVYPADGNEAATLFRNADTALKEAKNSGARYLFHSAELNERIAEHIALEQRLIAAVEREEFEVHYQPKIDTRTDRIVGLEALLRWNSPDYGLVPPARFISALEDSELILDVGRWVVEQALADRAAWQAKGFDPLPVAVNVSPLQLAYPDFADMLFATLDARGAEPAALELEITENVIMSDIESSIARLTRLAGRGVTISIDDFGTGYSSLRYLAKLPLHALKIDRSFVDAMTADADSMTLVSTIIGLAHAFGLFVIAEGVELEDQAKMLKLMKCDQMQGYFFGRPQPADAIEALLARGEPER